MNESQQAELMRLRVENKDLRERLSAVRYLLNKRNGITLKKWEQGWSIFLRLDGNYFDKQLAEEMLEVWLFDILDPAYEAVGLERRHDPQMPDKYNVRIKAPMEVAQ